MLGTLKIDFGGLKRGSLVDVEEIDKDTYIAKSGDTSMLIPKTDVLTDDMCVGFLTTGGQFLCPECYGVFRGHAAKILAGMVRPRSLSCHKCYRQVVDFGSTLS